MPKMKRGKKSGTYYQRCKGGQNTMPPSKRRKHMIDKIQTGAVTNLSVLNRNARAVKKQHSGKAAPDGVILPGAKVYVLLSKWRASRDLVSNAFEGAGIKRDKIKIGAFEDNDPGSPWLLENKGNKQQDRFDWIYN